MNRPATTMNRDGNDVRRRSSAFGFSLLVAAAMSAQAQQAPDAGQTLQQQLSTPPAPPHPAREVDIPQPKIVPAAPGGTQFKLRAVRFAGNTVFDDAALQAAVGDVADKQVDMAGLLALVDAVGRYYRDRGYPFARALMPPQRLDDGVLRVEIVEGRYGRVQAVGDDAALVAQAQPFLAALQPGAVIRSAPLERSTLLLDDLPGIEVAPIMRPGQAVGTGDLEVGIRRAKTFGGDAGLDNHGNRYTGQWRALFNVEADGILQLGDQASLHSVVTAQAMWFGQVGYALPLGASGLRGQAGYARSEYELGKEFASLQAHGTADVASLGLSYPLLRSQRANLNLGATYQHKVLADRQDAAGTHGDKSSDALPLTLGFDRRDDAGGGGVTYGALGWTHGRLRLDDALRATDATTAHTAGDFDKFNLDLARVQSLPGAFSLFGRWSGQWTRRNLDSSEGFGLGGPDGVRAYPTGEGFGDRGWVGQLELRYAMGACAPYLFYDSGAVTRNARPWADGDNVRRIGGNGVGLRVRQGAWHVEAAVAWRAEGGASQADTRQRDAMGWVSVAWGF